MTNKKKSAIASGLIERTHLDYLRGIFRIWRENFPFRSRSLLVCTLRLYSLQWVLKMPLLFPFRPELSVDCKRDKSSTSSNPPTQNHTPTSRSISFSYTSSYLPVPPQAGGSLPYVKVKLVNFLSPSFFFRFTGKALHKRIVPHFFAACQY